MRMFGLAMVLVCALLSGCSGSDVVRNEVFVPTAPDVSAMAVRASNDVVYFANRATGDVFGSDQPRKVLAHVDVSSDGQRGLLGLALDSTGRLFAAYTASVGERRMTVAQMFPGPQRTVWTGPPSTDLANGGHIAFAPDGRLVIGIGDLLDRSKLTDPSAPNGKLLALRPDESERQQPSVISSGWNNPFAFTLLRDGRVWVGDNEPGDGEERLARADEGRPTHITKVAPHTVMSGLAQAPDGSLWQCTYLTRKLQRFVIDGDGNARRKGSAGANDCSLGVVALNDGRIVYSTGSELRVVTP